MSSFIYSTRELSEELQDKADSSGAHGVDPDVLSPLLQQANELFASGEYRLANSSH